MMRPAMPSTDLYCSKLIKKITLYILVRGQNVSSSGARDKMDQPMLKSVQSRGSYLVEKETVIVVCHET